MVSDNSVAFSPGVPAATTSRWSAGTNKQSINSGVPYTLTPENPHLCIPPSIHLSIYLSIYLSAHPSNKSGAYARHLIKIVRKMQHSKAFEWPNIAHTPSVEEKKKENKPN